MPGDGNRRRPGGTRREDSFLARWSRRKHEAGQRIAVDENEAAETPNDTDAQPAEADTAPADTEPPVEETGVSNPDGPPEDADLPHPDTLDQDSDFSAYLTKRVSSTFRRAAMRRLFSSPGFNVRDGLDDYDEDYSQFQSLGSTVTAHMRHHAERLRQRDEDKAGQAERDAEAERERTAEQGEPGPPAEQDADRTRATDEQLAEKTDDSTPADDAPDPKASGRTPTSQDTDDTT